MKASWRWILFSSCVLLLLISHFFFYYGHFGIDDMYYSRLANDLTQGILDWGDHYTYRWTIISALAYSYQSFGISDLASALPSLFLMVLFFWFWIKESISIQHGILSIALLFAYQWHIFYSDKMMPDIYVAVFSFIAVMYYIDGKASKSLFYPAVFTGFLFLGFVSKGTIILLLPLLVFFFCSDHFRKKHRRFWLWTILFHLILYSIYFGFFHFYLGDSFARFTAIEANSYFNPCSYNLMPRIETIKRLSLGFLTFSIEHHLVIPFLIFGIAALRWSSLSTQQRFYLKVGVICSLSANFMTISFSGYNPTCLDPRHFLALTPLLFWSASWLFVTLHWERKSTLLLTLVSVIIGSYFVHNQNYISILPCLGLCIYTYAASLNIHSNLALIGVVVLLISTPTWHYMQYSRSLNYQDTKHELQTFFSQTNASTLYGSHVLMTLGNYFQKYEHDAKLSIHDIKESIPAPSVSVDQYLVRNWYCDWHSELRNGDVRKWIKTHGITLDTIVEDFNHLEIYKIKFEDSYHDDTPKEK